MVGSIETKHDCCDDHGKPVFNARSIKRAKTTAYTDEENDILGAYARTGAEQVHNGVQKSLSSTLGRRPWQRNCGQTDSVYSAK